MKTPDIPRCTFRDRLMGDEGGVKTIIATVGAVAIAGMLIYKALPNFNTHEEVTITAEAVADEFTLPASLEVVDVKGGSNSSSAINFKFGPVPIGTVNFASVRTGETVIKVNVLKNPEDNNVTPEASNLDKYVHLSVDETGNVPHLVIQVDPNAVEAATQNMMPGNGSYVNTDGLIDWTRSLPPDLSAQIDRGSAMWNDENFRLGCAQEFTRQDLLKAGIAKAVITQIQVSSDAIITAVFDSSPELKKLTGDKDVLAQIKQHIAELTDAKTVEVQFVNDPNNPQAAHTAQSQDDISYMQTALPTKEAMANDIGLKQDTISDFTLNRIASCNLSNSVKQDLETIRDTWSKAMGQQGGK